MVDSDFSYGNIILDFKEDPKVFFIPQVLEPQNAGFNMQLINLLQAAFASGRTMAVVRFLNNAHFVVAAFKNDGQFVVVDSMSSLTICDINQLKHALNQAKITDSLNQPIQFQGSYQIRPSTRRKCLQLLCLPLRVSNG